MKKQWFYRILFYALGLIILSFGVTLNTKTDLGVSCIVSMPFSISSIWNLNFAWTTFAVYTVLVLIQFPIRGKKSRLTDLLQIPFALIFSVFLDLFDMTVDIGTPALWLRYLYLAAAIVCTAVGAAMTVNAKLVPNPADGLAAAVGDAFRKDMGFGKNFIDITSVCITCIIGLVFAGKIAGVGIGTLAAMILVGRCIALFNKLCKPKMQKLSGISV